jgi:LytTr DNA-binding domain-containing protein
LGTRRSAGSAVSRKTSGRSGIDGHFRVVNDALQPRTRHHLHSLIELDSEFEPARFCRIHRAAIVNLERIRSLELKDDGEYEVVLETGTFNDRSRRGRPTPNELPFINAMRQLDSGHPEMGRSTDYRGASNACQK